MFTGCLLVLWGETETHRDKLFPLTCDEALGVCSSQSASWSPAPPTRDLKFDKGLISRDPRGVFSTAALYKCLPATICSGKQTCANF